MAESGGKPRKVRRRMPKVPKGAQANGIHLAGLSGNTGTGHGNRLDHEAAGGRSENIGRFGQFVLRHMGRYPETQDPAPD